MHPSPAFAWSDQDEMMEFVANRGFATIFVAGREGPKVAHAPILVTPDRRVQFHLANSNRATPSLPGNQALVSVLAMDSFHSANWYASDNQVPTWHYQAVEIEGRVRAITTEELVGQLDALSSKFETVFQPDRPWTRDKLDPRRFDALTRAITGFEIAPDEIRGTRKYNQHKSRADIDANVTGLEQAGRGDVAQQIRRLWRGK